MIEQEKKADGYSCLIVQNPTGSAGWRQFARAMFLLEESEEEVDLFEDEWHWKAKALIILTLSSFTLR